MAEGSEPKRTNSAAFLSNASRSARFRGSVADPSAMKVPTPHFEYQNPSLFEFAIDPQPHRVKVDS